MTIYITLELALATHRSTIEHSGGGDCSDINIGYLESALEMVQNDDYYPSFKDKLVHLVWSVNRNHSFSDGNKRLSITIGVLFLSLNGYLYCIKRFLSEMENISYHLAAGRIEKELLDKLISSILDGEEDFNEQVKMELFLAIADETIGFDE